MFDFLVSVFFSAILLFLGYDLETELLPTPTPEVVVEQASTESAQFVRVVDGDTLKVRVNNKEETIRIIGINTPETVDPRKAVECFGNEATQFAKDFFASSSAQLVLTADSSQGDQDRYQRLLRYVAVGENDYGKSAIEEGYAYEYTYDSPYQKQELYRASQQTAQENEKGLWAENACVK